jgi:NDP-sugar pyrophosphorylase family protein
MEGNLLFGRLVPECRTRDQNRNRSDRQSGTHFGALVLAGSYGWGTGHIAALPPRPLADVALRPAISYAIEWLAAGGAPAVTICANQSSHLLRDRLGEGYEGTALHYRGDQLPRGPAGSLRDAIDDIDADRFVVVEGTLIPQLDLDTLLDAHARTGAAMTMVTAGTPDRLAPAGIYVIERAALAEVPTAGFQDLKETLLPRLHRAGARVLPFALAQDVPRVATLDGYLAANAWVVERLTGHAAGTVFGMGAEPPAGALIVGPVLVGTGARIEPGATIVGPAVIGHRSVVAEGALVSRSVIGDGCTIGRGAMVHSSLVTDHTPVADGAGIQRRLQLPAATLAARLSGLFGGRREPVSGRAGARSHPVPGALPVSDARAETL